MDTSTAKLLQEIVRRESLSLLTYVGDAFPWVTNGNGAALAQLRQIIAEHNKAVTTFGRTLVRWRISPSFIGSFPSEFTTLNFLALSHILPRLVESERRLLTTLETEAAEVEDAQARAAIGNLLTVKRDHLARLESLVSSSASRPTSAAS